MEASVKANSRGFSAPINIAKAARAAVEVPTFEGGLARERELFTELSKGSQASAMQYQFFAERSTSNPPAVPDSSKVPQVSSVGIIGGGTMGAGIAMCFAEAGLSVTLVETSAETAVACRNRIEKVYKASSAYKSGKMTDDSVNKLLGMITFSSDMQSLNNADMVIEAVFENMNTKKEIFTKLDRICKPGAILATNTSYLDIDEIASVTSRIQNVIGTRKLLHNIFLFINLLSLSPLLYLSLLVYPFGYLLLIRFLLPGECHEAAGSYQRLPNIPRGYFSMHANRKEN
jgi:3-hydroxyacyl-CoA dehydrogenase